MPVVRDFTGGAVTLEEMVEAKARGDQSVLRGTAADAQGQPLLAQQEARHAA
jgi:hypothetical protein